MNSPLVTVICLSYNHAAFIHEAIDSVINQTYRNVEIILVDDASSDGTQAIIENYAKQHPRIKTILLKENVGNCRAFNLGLKISSGDYIVDFATDDVMLPHRLEKQVEQFQNLDDSCGVVFSDALYIDELGKVKYAHFEKLFKNRLLRHIPEGDVYRDVLSTYFIPSPTMTVRRKVFETLGGYDESLSYEDFDFWVRSARNYKYAYLPILTTKIRVSRRSMSRGWYKQGDRQLRSTYEVCKKAIKLNQTAEDTNALAKRLKFEIRQSIFSGNNTEAKMFYNLLQEIGRNSFLYQLLIMLNALRLRLSPIRNLYHLIRYGKR